MSAAAAHSAEAGVIESRPAARASGLVLAGAAAAVWLGFLAVNGPAEGNDTAGYLRLADAFRQGQIITSFRTPGYPLVLACMQAGAAALGIDFRLATAVLQTLALAGLGTWLVHDLGVRLSGRRLGGAIAAVLVATDADLQQFGLTLLPEAVTVVLALATLWRRIDDGGWRRASWGLGLLALVRPNLAVLALAFALLDAIRLRRVRALLVMAPTLALVGSWWLVSWAAGADPLRPYRWFVPMHTFGTVYEAGLWQRLPDGPERGAVAEARARGLDPYKAAAAIEQRLGPGSVARVARATVRADPVGYARVRAGYVKAIFRQGSWMRAELMQLAHPSPIVVGYVGAWRDRYRKLLFASFPLFVVLLAAACWRGLGFPAAAEAFRGVLGPFVLVLFATTALASLSNYDLGRLGLAFRPVNALLWGLACGWVVTRVAERLARLRRE